MKIPLKPKFQLKRWSNILFRTLHLVGFAGVFATALNYDSNHFFWGMTLASGLVLLALEILPSMVWFIQVRSLFMYIKFLMLFGLYYLPEYAMFWLILMIVISGIISHAPSSLRYYSFIYRKKIESFNDIGN